MQVFVWLVFLAKRGFFSEHSSAYVLEQNTSTVFYLPFSMASKRKVAKCSGTCHVCGDKASHHKHYGCNAQVCYSCRAFFRRCVKKKKIPVAIQCNNYLYGPGTCPIQPETRSLCRYGIQK